MVTGVYSVSSPAVFNVRLLVHRRFATSIRLPVLDLVYQDTGERIVSWDVLIVLVIFVVKIMVGPH